MMIKKIILLGTFLILLVSAGRSSIIQIDVPNMTSIANTSNVTFTEVVWTINSVNNPLTSASCVQSQISIADGTTCYSQGGTAGLDEGMNWTFQLPTNAFINSVWIQVGAGTSTGDHQCDLSVYNYSSSSWLRVNTSATGCVNGGVGYLGYNFSSSSPISPFKGIINGNNRMQFLLRDNSSTNEDVLIDIANATINYTLYAKLNVTFITPSSSPLTVQKDGTFNVTVNVTCDMGASLQTNGAGCGSVNATIFWNKTSNTNPDTELNGTIGQKPLYNFSSLVNYSCGAMASNSQCKASWLVNATGYLGQDIYINVTARSSVGSNISANFTIAGGPASFLIQIRDINPPNITVNSPGDGSIYGLSNGTINVNITAIDFGIGNISNASFWISNYSDGNVTPWIQMKNNTNFWTNWNKTLNWSNWGPKLYEGKYNITFNVTDGNPYYNQNVTVNISVTFVGRPKFQNVGESLSPLPPGSDNTLFSQFTDLLNMTYCYLATNETSSGSQIWWNYTTTVSPVKDYVDEASGGGDDVAKWNKTQIPVRPESGEGTAFTTAQYTNISTEGDDLYKNDSASGISYAVHKFSFLINTSKNGEDYNKSVINTMNVTWRGVLNGSGFAFSFGQMYAYNSATGTWTLMAESGMSQISREISIIFSANNISNYINNSGYVSIKVYSPQDGSETGGSYIATDYINLTYSYGQYYFSPKHGNYTASAINGYLNQSFVWNNASVSSGTIGWIIGCNDSMGNWNQTSVQTFLVQSASNLQFTVTLAGAPSGNISTEVFPGNITEDIWFNATGLNSKYIEPCRAPGGGSNCQSRFSTPIMTFKNTGNVAFNISITLNASLPSYVKLWGNWSNLTDMSTCSGWTLGTNDTVITAGTWYNFTRNMCANNQTAVWLFANWTDAQNTKGAPLIDNATLNYSSTNPTI